MSNDEKVGMTDQQKLELRRRCGKLVVPAKLVAQDPDLMMRVMAECIVVRAEYLAMFDLFEYQVYSPLIPILEEGRMTPEYNIQHDLVEDTITFTEVK